MGANIRHINEAYCKDFVVNFVDGICRCFRSIRKIHEVQTNTTIAIIVSGIHPAGGDTSMNFATLEPTNFVPQSHPMVTRV